MYVKFGTQGVVRTAVLLCTKQIHTLSTISIYIRAHLVLIVPLTLLLRRLLLTNK